MCVKKLVVFRVLILIYLSVGRKLRAYFVNEFGKLGVRTKYYI